MFGLHGKIIAADTETTGLHPHIGDRPFMFSFADVHEKAKVISFPVDPFTRRVMYEKRPIAYKKLRQFFADESVTKVFFNALFDVTMIEAAGMEIRGPIEDLSHAVRIIGIPRAYWKLKAFSKKFLRISDEDEKLLSKAVTTILRRARALGWNVDGGANYWLCELAEEALCEGVKHLKTWRNAGAAAQVKRIEQERTKAEKLVPMCATYAKLDAVRTIRGWLAAKDALKDSEQEHIYEEEMRQVFHVVKNMYDVGMRLHMRNVRRGRRKAMTTATTILKKIRKKTWRKFNPGSPQDKVKYFIDQCGLTPLSYTPKGNPQVDKHFFEYYDASNEACALMNEYTSCIKATSTYFDAFATQHANKILKDRMNQIGTVTGRMSGWLHTIPKRAKEGSIMLEVRRCFRPRPNHVWYCVDYSQIEARIFADEFEEWTMIEAFAANRDVYVELKQTILEDTGVEIIRQIAKNIFLGKLYGLGVKKMVRAIRDASTVEIDDSDARDVIYAFDQAFPIVSQAMRMTEKKARSQGYVENRYGQRVPVDADFAYRGVNYIIQPTAARLMKRAMWKCYEYLKRAGVGNVLLQIHDELVFELPLDCSHEEHMMNLKIIMEDNDGMFPHVTTPVEVDVCRKTWLDRKPARLEV